MIKNKTNSLYTFYAAVAITENIIKLNELKAAAHKLIESNLGRKLLSHLLKYLAYEYGPQYVRNLWAESRCQWKDFLNDDDPKEFIKENVSTYINKIIQFLRFFPIRSTNQPILIIFLGKTKKLEFVENPKATLVAVPIQSDKFKKRIREYLVSKKPTDEIIEYIKVICRN